MRIEQQPNGTYVKRVNTLEEQIIERLYKEINDRESDVAALTIRIDGLDGLTQGMSANMEAMDVRIRDMEEKVNQIFGAGTEALIDKNLNVAGYAKATYFVSTRTTGAPLEVYSADMVDNLNAEFLGGKRAEDFAPATHIGKGGNAHALATDILDGFMSKADYAKLRDFGSATDYTLKTEFTAVKEDYYSHKGAGGTAHKLASETEDGFMSKEDKTAVNNLPTSLGQYVKKTGDNITGNFRFTEDSIGLFWDSKVNAGSDYARIVFVGDSTAESTEDATLLIEVGNDGPGTTGPDRITIQTLTENSVPASEISIKTVKKDGSTTGGKINLVSDTVEATKDIKSQKMITNAIQLLGQDLHVFNLKSTGLDGASPQFNTGFWFDGQQIMLGGWNEPFRRGYNIAAWHRTNQTFTWVSTYDIHADTAQTTAATEVVRLANDLNSLDSNHIVFIWGYDQVSFENRAGDVPFTQTQIDNAINALQRCGASGRVRNMPYRSSYVLVGIPGIGKGNGQEMFQYPGTVDLYSLIIGKHPIGMGYKGA